MNKKGTGYGTWVETILLSVAFLSILGLIVGGFNSLYGKDYNIPISDRTNSTGLFQSYVGNSSDRMKGGEVSFTSEGALTLKTSWDLIMDISSITWNFITGGWIGDLVRGMQLGTAGEVLAITLQILYFISVVLAGLYALFKVVL